jgi:hypothetical protein
MEYLHMAAVNNRVCRAWSCRLSLALELTSTRSTATSMGTASSHALSTPSSSPYHSSIHTPPSSLVSSTARDAPQTSTTQFKSSSARPSPADLQHILTSALSFLFFVPAHSPDAQPSAVYTTSSHSPTVQSDAQRQFSHDWTLVS